MTGPSEDDGPKPRYKWVLTTPELAKDDFKALLPNGDYFGRIYGLHSYPNKGKWFWTVTEPDWLKGARAEAMPLSGQEKSARWAAKAVEDGFERVVKVKGYDLERIMSALDEASRKT